MMLDRIDDLTRRAAELTARIKEQIAPSPRRQTGTTRFPASGAPERRS